VTTEMIVTVQLRVGTKVISTESTNAGHIDGLKFTEVATIAAAEAKNITMTLMEQSKSEVES
jgi:hypothetical protein